MVDNIVPNLVPDGTARLNITYQGNNGDLPDPVLVDASDEQIRRMASEALLAGNIPGIPAVANVNLADFVVDRFAATKARPYSMIQLRPKTPFGSRLP